MSSIRDRAESEKEKELNQSRSSIRNRADKELEQEKELNQS